jgi:transcriptional regulator with XRE-family HTH domain
MKIGELIKTRRKELGWTEAALAEMIFTSVSFLRSVESCKSLPGERTLMLLCKVLGLKYDAIIIKYKHEKHPDILPDDTHIQEKEPIYPDSPNFKLTPKKKFHTCDGCSEQIPYNTGFRLIVMHNGEDMLNRPMLCNKCFWALLHLTISHSKNNGLIKAFAPFNEQLQEKK